MLHIQCYLSLSHRGHKSIGATHISDLHLWRRLRSFTSHLLSKVSQPLFPALFKQVEQKLLWEIFTPQKDYVGLFFYPPVALICSGHAVLRFRGSEWEVNSLAHPPTDPLFKLLPCTVPQFSPSRHAHTRPSSFLFSSVTSLAPGRCTSFYQIRNFRFSTALYVSDSANLWSVSSASVVSHQSNSNCR